MSATTTFCGLEMNAVRQTALEKLFSRISDVASFPATAQRLMELTNDDDGSTDEIRELIQTDPAMVANILRRVNSAYYGLNKKVADIRTAVSMLGIREIRTLAISIFLSKFSEKQSDYKTFTRRKLWDHCAAVGVAARQIAKSTNKAVPEEAYMAGLLHDIGFILCDQFLHAHFCKVIDQINEQTPTTKVENSILTFDHAMLGGFVARKWNFPEAAQDAIIYHHRPEEYEGPHAATLAAVVLANYWCSQQGSLSLGVMNIARPPASIYTTLGLNDEKSASLEADVRGLLEKSAAASVN